MILLALAIAPGLAISVFFILRDQYNPEPRRHLWFSFFLGCISAILAAVIEESAFTLLGIKIGASILGTAVAAFILVGLTEEWSKYVMVRYYAFKKPAFDEPLDGIVYSVMVSMGFATLENIGYVYEHGMGTAVVRMFVSVPAHACFAVILGYYLGKAKFSLDNRSGLILTGLAAAAFWHGLFDFFLFLQENHQVKTYVSDGLLVLGALLSYALAFRLSRKAVAIHTEHSRENQQSSLN